MGVVAVVGIVCCVGAGLWLWRRAGDLGRHGPNPDKPWRVAWVDIPPERTGPVAWLIRGSDSGPFEDFATREEATECYSELRLHVRRYGDVVVNPPFNTLTEEMLETGPSCRDPSL